MKIRWLTTACIQIQEKDTTLLFDPYLHTLNPALPAVSAWELAQSSACLITHPHLDHFADMQRLLDAGLSCVYGSAQMLANARRNQIDTTVLQEIRPYETIQIGPFSIQALPSLHIRFDKALIKSRLLDKTVWQQFSAGMKLLRQNRRFPIQHHQCLAYLVQCRNMEILIFGSAALDPRVCYPLHTDLLVLAAQGQSDMAPIVCSITAALQPEALLLDHFDDSFPPLSQNVDLQPVLAALQKEFPHLPVIIPKSGQWICLNQTNSAPFV